MVAHHLAYAVSWRYATVRTVVQQLAIPEGWR